MLSNFKLKKLIFLFDISKLYIYIFFAFFLFSYFTQEPSEYAENFVIAHFLMPCLSMGTLKLINKPIGASAVAKWMII